MWMLCGAGRSHGSSVAGIRDPAMRLLQDVNSDGDAKAMPLLTMEAIADHIVSSGLASAAEVTAAIGDLRHSPPIRIP
jgi:hypothetical protein